LRRWVLLALGALLLAVLLYAWHLDRVVTRQF